MRGFHALKMNKNTVSSGISLSVKRLNLIQLDYFLKKDLTPLFVMDPDILRFILFSLGVVLIIGIYIAGHRNRLFRRSTPTQRQQELDNDPVLSDASLATIVPDQSSVPVHDLPTLQATHELPPSDMPLFAAAETTAAPEESVPPLIIQLQVVTRSEPFQAAAVLEAADLTGLIYEDEQQIYLRVHDGPQPIIFRVANLMKPGTLPGVDDADFCTSGLVLFAVLPCAWDGLAVFSDLISTAERIASHLKADVLNEDRKPLTRQSLQFTRDSILDHRRQLHLARCRG